MNPPPSVGTTLAVEVIPYNGYGCIDTLYARLIDTFTVKALAGKDLLSCNGNKVQIGAKPNPGVIYSWSPTIGLSNPEISNPFASPDSTLSYILTAGSYGGGCIDKDTVLVKTTKLDNSLLVIGKTTFCEGSNDNTILRVWQADSIQWFRNGLAISGSTQTNSRVIQSGSYYATLFAKDGCAINTIKQDVLIEKTNPGIRYPEQYAVINFPATLEARKIGTYVSWTPGLYLDNPTGYNPVFKSNTDQLYTIRLTTTAGCITVDTQLVKAVKKVEMYVPNAFTPNNDGKNDYLRPILIGIKSLHYFRVFNRWGQIVFELKNPDQGWNGTFKGLTQSTQIVVWIMEGIGLDGIIHRKKGTTVLIH